MMKPSCRQTGGRVRRSSFAVLVALAVATSWVATGAAGPEGGARVGGTFRIALPAGGVTSIDPFLDNGTAMAPIRNASCGSLLKRRDEPLPAGRELRPELAEGFPEISRDGKTYTFTLKQGHRFSTGAPVTARDVAATVRRALRLKDSFVAAAFLDVVGARAFQSGRSARLAGVVVKGNRIAFRLTKRVPSFHADAGLLCLLPANLPLNPEGVRPHVPSAGPYAITRHVPGRQIVLERNRFYRGPRPRRVDRFDVALVEDDTTLPRDVEQGRYDWAFIPPPNWRLHVPRLVSRYGVNRGRFFVTRGRGVCILPLNASGPLFRNNPRLRRAVSFAIDRAALVRERGLRESAPADQYLQPHQNAYRAAHIFPFRPDVRRAKELANGNTRGGKAVFYVPENPLGRAHGAIVRANLAAIGLDVKVTPIPFNNMVEKLRTRGEPFDIGWICWLGGAPDAPFLHMIFDGRQLRSSTEHFNFSHFDVPRINRRLDEISRLTGRAFQREYGDLDVELARDYVPAVAYAYLNELTLVSARTGCVVNNPFFNLAAVCLR
jgi:peptide/nickel transport system substrate-binding protein